ncbi:MAG: RHS repeat domain-containing protein, partial [Acidimicrobiales bacterium]
TKTLPSGTGVVSAYTYDNADRLTGISHVKGGSTTLASVAYTLDDMGNRTQRVDQQGTHTYEYDDLYRLTSVTYPGPSTTTYAFDAFGNRTSMTVGAAQTTYAYDDADRLTTVTPPSPASAVAYAWDDNGSLTARGSDSFAWDYEERMTSATVNSVTTTFAYRGDGLRDSRTTGMTTVGFTWDIAAGLPVVIDDGNRYVYGAGLEAQVSGSDTYYFLADGLGSTMAMVDSTGTVQKSYTYDVYGKPTATGSLPNEFDFAGQQTDPTGLQYLRARYMDPETGTFLSREPLARSPRWTAPNFAYANGNPASLVDPSGLAPVDGDGCELGNTACSEQYAWHIRPPADTPGVIWREQYFGNGVWGLEACALVRLTDEYSYLDCAEMPPGLRTKVSPGDACHYVIDAELSGVFCTNPDGNAHFSIQVNEGTWQHACLQGAIVGEGFLGIRQALRVFRGTFSLPSLAAVAAAGGLGCAGGLVEHHLFGP